jgi:hypothetical protein
MVQQDRDVHAPAPTTAEAVKVDEPPTDERAPEWKDGPENDERDLSWSAVLKRTFEGYVRGERPNMYGEWMKWE